MMDNMLVAVFETERQALVVARKMKDLSVEDLVLVYALAVIVRGSENIAIVNLAGDQQAADPALGIAIHSLIGLLDGSRNATEESAAECTTDRMMELANAGVDTGFLDKVSRHLLPGSAAVVSEIEAESLSRIDSFVESEGGIVLRCVRHEVFDAQIAKELDELRRTIQNIEDRLLHAPDGSNAQLRVMLDLAKDKFQTTKDRVRHRAASIKFEAEAKIVSLQEHAAKADRRIKARLERLANEVRVDYVNRATALNLAWQIGREV